MPDVLLKTVDMIVRAMVPPNVKATLVTEITVEMWSGKKPMACRLPTMSQKQEAYEGRKEESTYQA